MDDQQQVTANLEGIEPVVLALAIALASRQPLVGSEPMASAHRPRAALSTGTPRQARARDPRPKNRKG